ncbi:unnamed protein product [Rotaria sp. Silwood1]|nr:unnamed protein product [Rotaria sp. Silwood1]
MLNKPDVLTMLIKNINGNVNRNAIHTDLMFNYRHALDAKQHQVLKNKPNALLFQLYIDDIGLTNPIGPKKDTQKITMIYFQLEDLPDTVRSMLNSIELIAMCHSSYLCNKSNRKKFFDAIIEYLNALQSTGIFIPTLRYHLNFTFTILAGDHLASNDIGGFQKIFSTGEFCRHCHINYDQKLIPLNQISHPRRITDQHNYIVQKVIDLDNNAVLQGVADRSPLANLIGFHAVRSLPNDPMHDFHEGVCGQLLMAILKEASAKRLLTYGEIESRLISFEYGMNDKSNKPPILRKKHLNKGKFVGEDIDGETLFYLPQYMMYDIIKPMKERVHFLAEHRDLFHGAFRNNSDQGISEKYINHLQDNNSQQLLEKRNFNQVTTQTTVTDNNVEPPEEWNIELQRLFHLLMSRFIPLGPEETLKSLIFQWFESGEMSLETWREWSKWFNEGVKLSTLKAIKWPQASPGGVIQLNFHRALKTIPTDDFQEKDGLIAVLKLYLQEPEIKIDENGTTLNVVGRTIFLSSIKKKIESMMQGTTILQVDIVARDVFHIDTDLEGKDWQGKNLCVVTEKVNVWGDRIIDVSGSGYAEQNWKAQNGGIGCDGENGKDGRPGESSGNIAIMTKDILNPQKLKLVLNGGNGENGQNGGDGGDGADGKGVTMDELKAACVKYDNPNKRTMIYSLASYAGWTYSWYELFVWIQGTDGTAGGVGGRNGCGGEGGNQGECNVINSDTGVEFTAVNITKNPGRNGTDGTVGECGKSGNNGNHMAVIDRSASGTNKFFYGEKSATRLKMEYYVKSDTKRRINGYRKHVEDESSVFGEFEFQDVPKGGIRKTKQKQKQERSTEAQTTMKKSIVLNKLWEKAAEHTAQLDGALAAAMVTAAAIKKCAQERSATKRSEIIASVENFLTTHPIEPVEAALKWVNAPQPLIALGLIYVDQQEYPRANTIFDSVITKCPEFAGEAGYYKGIIEQQSVRKVKEIPKDIKESITKKTPQFVIKALSGNFANTTSEAYETAKKALKDWLPDNVCEIDDVQRIKTEDYLLQAIRTLNQRTENKETLHTIVSRLRKVVGSKTIASSGFQNQTEELKTTLDCLSSSAYDMIGHAILQGTN